MEARSTFRNNETRPKRSLAGKRGLVSFLPATFIGWRYNYKGYWHKRLRPAYIIIDLHINRSIPLDQFGKQLMFLLLLLHFLIDMILKKLLLIELEHRVKLQQFIGSLLFIRFRLLMFISRLLLTIAVHTLAPLCRRTQRLLH